MTEHFCAVRNTLGGRVGLQCLGWAGHWAAKLQDLGCGNFSGNFKDFLKLELLWVSCRELLAAARPGP